MTVVANAGIVSVDSDTLVLAQTLPIARRFLVAVRTLYPEVSTLILVSRTGPYELVGQGVEIVTVAALQPS